VIYKILIQFQFMGKILNNANPKKKNFQWTEPSSPRRETGRPNKVPVASPVSSVYSECEWFSNFMRQCR
jgi:hypothetical protein